MDYLFRKLRANEIECRVGTVGKQEVGLSLLLYKDARVDMNILDETFGIYGWQRDHKELKEWITKWDCGKESQTESEKGEASDSFKRACFNLGIGRELYTAPFIWIEGASKSDRFSVKSISISDDRVITELTIVNAKTGVVVFSFPKNVNKPKPNPQLNKDTALFTVDQIKELESYGYEIYQVADRLKKPCESITFAEMEQVLNKIKASKGVK